MKKYTAAAIGVALAATVFFFIISNYAAERSDGRAETHDMPKVVASVFPYYDFARQIGQDRIDLTLLLKPGMESHTFDPSPQDMLKIAKCDIFIYTGGESDHWAHKVADAAKEDGKMKPLMMLGAVTPLEEDDDHGHDHGHGHGHGETDEHIWTSPKNALKLALRIKEALCEAAPQNKKYYEKNFIVLAKKLRKLDADYAEAVRTAKRRTIVFGDRYPFRYLDEAYGLHAEAAFPGCAAETEASAATVARLINIVKKDRLPVVFHIEMSNEKTADAICRETGAKKLLLHSCHNVTPEELDSGATYVGLMRVNLKNLKEALN